MYATEYDLLVAQDRLRARQDEIRAIRLARHYQAEAIVRPSLLDRLIAFTARVTHTQGAQGKVGAAA